MKKLLLLGIVLIIAVVALPYIVPQPMPTPATWLKTSSISLYSRTQLECYGSIIGAVGSAAAFAFTAGASAVPFAASVAGFMATCPTWPGETP